MVPSHIFLVNVKKAGQEKVPLTYDSQASKLDNIVFSSDLWRESFLVLFNKGLVMGGIDKYASEAGLQNSP